MERRNQILAALCMMRSDVSSQVRQQAMLVWKAVVDNTPKTLREITPPLMTLVIAALGSSSYDKRQVAGRTLGDLVSKLGDRIMPELVPILERGLDNRQPVATRQGVCLALSEVLANINHTQLPAFITTFIPAVRRALCDPLPEVREAAAHAFDTLYDVSSERAVEEIM